MALNFLEEIDITDGGDTFYEGMEKTKNNFSTLDTEIHNARDGEASLIAKLDTIYEFPTGTKMVFYQDTAPTGWTIENTLNDKLLFVTKGSAAGGETGGGAHSTGTWTQPDHTLLEAELPAHEHEYVRHSLTTNIQQGSGATVNNVHYGNSTVDSETIGSGSAHNHGDTWRPAAYCVIIATKD